MVEQNAVAGIYAVGLAVVHRDPVGVKLCHPVWAARIKGCGFLLRNLLHQAVELTGACLINASFGCEAQDPNRLEDAKSAEGVRIGGVFRRLKTNGYMALSTKVVDLIRLHLLDDSNQVGTIGKIAIVEHKPRIAFMRVLVEVIDSGGIETTGPAFDPVHYIALLKQQLSQIAAILPSNTGNKGCLGGAKR